MDDFQLRTAEYIREMTRELALLARGARLRSTVDLLDMVYQNTGEQIARLRNRESLD